MKKMSKRLMSAILAATMLGGFSTVSYARVQSHNAAFVYNFETEDDFTKKYVSATGNNAVAYSEDGFGGSAGAMKVDVVNGGETIVSLGDMDKGYYKLSAYVKPIDFTSAVDNFTFVLYGKIDGTAATKVICSESVGLEQNKWTKVDAYYLLTDDVVSASAWLRLGDKNRNFNNTVGSTGLTSYSYLIDDISVERVADSDPTVVYKRSFDTKQGIADIGLNRNGNTPTFETDGGCGHGRYALLPGGTAFKFSDSVNGFYMKANRRYKATVYAKAANDASVGAEMKLFEDRVAGKGNSITVTEASGKKLTSEWQLFEFDNIRHFATANGDTQTDNFTSPNMIQLQISPSANVAIDEFTIYEYPTYYNGDFENGDTSHLTITGGVLTTEDGNSYLKFTDSSTGQILSKPYIEGGKSYKVKYKVRLDSLPKTKQDDGTYAENASQSIYAGFLFGYEYNGSTSYTNDYDAVQSKTPIYQEGDEIGQWISVEQSFTAKEADEGCTAYTPLAYFRVAGNIGGPAKTSVAFSVDDIEIIPYDAPVISELACEGNVKTEETVQFSWKNDIPAGKYIYRIYKESDDGWANIAMGTLTSAQTSVNYTIPETAAGKKLKFEITAVASSGRAVNSTVETTAVASGDVSSVITLTNAEDNAWADAGALTGKVTVTNSTVFTGTLFAALYSGGSLDSVQRLTTTKNSDGDYEFAVTGVDNADEIKVMHWETLDGMKAYAAAKSAEYIEE